MVTNLDIGKHTGYSFGQRLNIIWDQKSFVNIYHLFLNLVREHMHDWLQKNYELFSDTNSVHSSLSMMYECNF